LHLSHMCANIADQGVGGITISTSKAALYTLGAGINPNRILPVVLDVGTDNHALFSDPLYMGWKRTRLRGKNYDQFIEKFIRQCRELFPNAVIHFEDFGMTNAHRFMEKYKDIPMFNDDIQGTGAVALAALIAYVPSIARRDHTNKQRYQGIRKKLEGPEDRNLRSRISGNGYRRPDPRWSHDLGRIVKGRSIKEVLLCRPKWSASRIDG